MQIILRFINESISLWLEVSPYLLLGMLFAGLLHLFLGKEFISRQLGKGGISSVIKATLLGVPLPICSCGVIPIASSLEKDGAHKSSILSFLVSTPTTGIDSILATYSLLGPLFAIFRPLGAALAGITLGSIDYLIEGKKEKSKTMVEHKHQEIKISFKWKEFFRYSFFEIPQDIGKTLLIGIMLGGAISAFIPKDLFSQYFSYPLDFLVALVLGIPLYVCATGSIPIAVSLMEKGFSPGAGLIFLIAGPATNAITLAFVRTKLGKKSFYLYLLSIILVSLVLGFIFNHIWFALGKNIQLISGAGKMLPDEFKIVCGIALFVLVANAIFKPKPCPADLNVGIRIYVPDIHCQHCKLTLESALKELGGVESVFVDVKGKFIQIVGNVDKYKILEAIKKAGYNPKII